MIDSRVLKKFNTTNKNFRELFTADPSCELGEKRKKWEEVIESRIHEGVLFGLKNYKFYAASDLAWDSNLITKELVPLQMYAQGRIDFKALTRHLKDIPTEDLSRFCDIDGETKQIKNVRVGDFHKIFVNLVRSFITRRTAAVSLKYTKLYPFLKYEPVSTSWESKLRADVLSQRIEMVTNGYDYRHECVQAIRDMLLYGHTVEFVQGAWDKEKQVFVKQRAPGMGLGDQDDDSFETETRVVREGVLFNRPHPTRTFWDTGSSLASINTDTGCSYLGYWNIVRYRDVEKNTDYFNRSEITYESAFLSQLDAFRGYWELYFSNSPINFPGSKESYGFDPVADNDRAVAGNRYTSERGDESVPLVEYHERVIPRDVGLGDYPYPVWVRLVVAGGRTVVYGEFLPSTPATYWGFNEDDDRLINNAWAHDIMPWGDQLSNMLTQLVLTQKTSLIKIIAANIDLLTTDQVEALRKIASGNEYSAAPVLIEFQGAMLQGSNLDIEDVVRLNEANSLNDVTTFFRSIIQLLSLAERVLGVSAQELGQSAPREITATETTEISNTINTTLAFMGAGVDEAISAKKRLLYESFVVKGSDAVKVPVVNRYMPETVRAAGFEVVSTESPRSGVAKSYTLSGNKNSLIYDYNFSSRDGAERASNAKAAEVMVNLLAQLTQIPGVLQDLGKEKLYTFLNAVVRMSGAGVDLSFDVSEAEGDAVSTGDAAQDGKESIEEAMRMVLGVLEENKRRIDALEQGAPPAPVNDTSGSPLPRSPGAVS